MLGGWWVAGCVGVWLVATPSLTSSPATVATTPRGVCMRSLTQTPRCLSSSGSVASAGALPFLPMGSGRPAQLGPGAGHLGERARERAELRAVEVGEVGAHVGDDRGADGAARPRVAAPITTPSGLPDPHRASSVNRVATASGHSPDPTLTPSSVAEFTRERANLSFSSICKRLLVRKSLPRSTIHPANSLTMSYIPCCAHRRVAHLVRSDRNCSRGACDLDAH